MPSVLGLDVDSAKDYMQVDHTGDNTLIDDLLGEADGKLQAFIGRRLITDSGNPVIEHHDGGVGRLFLRHHPVDATTVIVTDTSGTVDTDDDADLEASEYRVDPMQGIIHRTGTYASPAVFGKGIRRWKVSYEGGLDLHPDWSAIELELKQSIRDLVAYLYEHRKPGAVAVGEGAGIRTDWELDERTGLPKRVARVWEQYEGIR